MGDGAGGGEGGEGVSIVLSKKIHPCLVMGTVQPRFDRGFFLSQSPNRTETKPWQIGKDALSDFYAASAAFHFSAPCL
jgi:hypothetical protein